MVWLKQDDQFKTVFIIDGKKITLDEFEKMLEPYTGYNFKLTMHDPCDDLPD